MADTKVSALTALSGASVATDDVVPIIDTSVTTSKKITVAELITALDALSTFAKTAEVVAQTLIDAKGDLVAGTAADTAGVLTVGANDTILMADSAAGTGLKWVASATPSTQALGDAAAVGTADTFTRGDHKHAMPTSLDITSQPFTINAQTDTYGVVLADSGKLVTCTKATAFTVTLPANGTIPIVVGTQIHFLQGGAGQITIAITSDTLSTATTLKTRAQYSIVTAIKLTSTTWVLTGDTAAS
jgi:hypothetical protein